MQVVITAVGPDNRGLADPIIHHVTAAGANIYEIQMYDHDSERLFAMLLRFEWPLQTEISVLRQEMEELGKVKNLSIRTWSRDENARPPRLAICTRWLKRGGGRHTYFSAAPRHLIEKITSQSGFRARLPLLADDSQR